jgi:hypothetical protein
MKRITKTLITLLIVFCSTIGFTQELDVQSKTEKITVQPNAGFVTEVTVIFKKSEIERLYPIMFDTELERVRDIQLFTKKRKRFKRQISVEIIEEALDLDYIASKQLKTVVIPPEVEAKLIYTISCEELMYFSSLHFFSYFSIDTLQYEVNIPKEFKWEHQTIHKDSLSYFSIDSIKTDTGSRWTVKVAPKKVAPDPLQLFGIYKKMKVPMMRTLVMPSSYTKGPIDYMSDWYMRNVNNKRGLDATIKQKIDALTAGVTDQRKIVDIIYNYVRNHFKYVAIEIGMGAFIPSPATEVYQNKQGDCKDLSNFLAEALQYKGIKSDIAMASTYTHILDCDFPSLSSANHVIGIAYIDGETILLDPTDPVHYQGTPVQSLQDRTILIVNDEGGSFYKVNAYDPKQNEISYQLDLKVDSQSM